MAKTRRFKVPLLKDAAVGQRVALAPAEAQHARVLRLDDGAAVERFDGAGQAWTGVLRTGDEAGAGYAVELTAPATDTTQGGRFRTILACAWPKGKRAATLVEKATELGVDEIVQLKCARGVVSKEAGSAGLDRLGRIAAEAAKQCGRNDVPAISGEVALTELVVQKTVYALTVLLHPGAPRTLSEALLDASERLRPHPGGEVPAVLCLVGPEGGFTDAELEAAVRGGVEIARLGPHTLRVETACLATCAVLSELQG